MHMKLLYFLMGFIHHKTNAIIHCQNIIVKTPIHSLGHICIETSHCLHILLRPQSSEMPHFINEWTTISTLPLSHDLFTQEQISSIYLIYSAFLLMSDCPPKKTSSIDSVRTLFRKIWGLKTGNILYSG